MEVEPGTSAIELTPIETISNNNLAVLFNDQTRFSNSEEMKSSRLISEGIKGLIEDQHKIMIKPNQVGIDVSANDDTTKSLNRKHQENGLSIWDAGKTWHENNALVREKIFESILQNDDTEFSWTNTTFYTFAIVLAGSSISIPYLLFPAHDIVKFPKYWYEILYHGSIFCFFDFAFFTALDGALLNIRHLKKYKTLTIVCTSVIGIVLLFDICAYYSWTLVWCFKFPIPFFAHIRHCVCVFLCCIGVWVMIPTEWRNQEGMKKRMKYIIVWSLANGMMVVCYQALIVTIRIFRGPYQPLIAIAFPASREMWDWFFRKIPKYCANGDERGATIEMLYAFYTNHTICHQKV